MRAISNVHTGRIWPEAAGSRFPTPGLDSCQYSNNTIILFAAQCKNDNTAFRRSSAVSGGPALLRAFFQC